MSDQGSTQVGQRDVVAQDAARLAAEGDVSSWAEPHDCVRDGGHIMSADAPSRADSKLAAVAADAIARGLSVSYAFCRRCGSGWVTVGEAVQLTD